MARIQITDLNPSESGLLYELTDEELLDINGGSLFGRIVGAIVSLVGIGVSFVNPPLGTGIVLGGAAIYELND